MAVRWCWVVSSLVSRGAWGGCGLRVCGARGFLSPKAGSGLRWLRRLQLTHGGAAGSAPPLAWPQVLAAGSLGRPVMIPEPLRPRLCSSASAWSG